MLELYVFKTLINWFDVFYIDTFGFEKYDWNSTCQTTLHRYENTFTYLKDKFKSCKPLYKLLSQNLEANCFSHTKRGEINTAVGIVNLKSNYGWTDRAETTLQGGDKPIQTTTINLGNGEKPTE